MVMCFDFYPEAGGWLSSECLSLLVLWLFIFQFSCHIFINRYLYLVSCLGTSMKASFEKSQLYCGYEVGFSSILFVLFSASKIPWRKGLIPYSCTSD